MEGDPGTAILEPAAADDSAAPAQPSAQPEAGEPGASRADRAQTNAALNGWLRGDDDGGLASKPTDGDTVGESAPQGDVKPADPLRGNDGRFLPRRAVPEVVRQAEDRAAQAEQRLAENDPAKLREQHWAEFQAEQTRQTEQANLQQIAQTRQADVERYYRLIEMPDATLSGEDYQWREDFKERLTFFPEVERFHVSAAEQRVANAEAAHVSTLNQQLKGLASRPGVDVPTFKSMKTFGDLGGHLYDAGARAKEAELAPQMARLAEAERELQQLRPAAFGALRTPVQAGRSSSAVPVSGSESMNNWFRNG